MSQYSRVQKEEEEATPGTVVVVVVVVVLFRPRERERCEEKASLCTLRAFSALGKRAASRVRYTILNA